MGIAPLAMQEFTRLSRYGLARSAEGLPGIARDDSSLKPYVSKRPWVLRSHDRQDHAGLARSSATSLFEAVFLGNGVGGRSFTIFADAPTSIADKLDTAISWFAALFFEAMPATSAVSGAC